MNMLTHIKLDKKLLFGFLFLVFIFLLISLFNLYIQSKMDTETEIQYQNEVTSMQTINSLSYEFEKLNGYLTTLLIKPKEDLDSNIFEQIDVSKTLINNNMIQIDYDLVNKVTLAGIINEREWKLFNSYWKAYDDEIDLILDQNIAHFDQGHLQFKYEFMLRSKIDPMEKYIQKWNDSIKQQLLNSFDEIEQRQNKLFIIQSFIIFLSILLSVSGISFIVKSITKPIKNIALETQKMASGNLTVNMKSLRNDEVGEMIRSFEQMANSIRTLLNQVVSEGVEIVKVNEMYLNTIDKMEVRSEEIVNSFSTVEEGISTQTTLLKENERQLELMNLRVEDLVANSTKSISSLKKIKSSTENAQQKVLNSDKKMIELVNDIKQSNASISILKEKIKRIIDISLVVNELSRKMTLLAHNTKIKTYNKVEKNHGFNTITEKIIEHNQKVSQASRELERIIQNVFKEFKTLGDKSEEINTFALESKQSFEKLQQTFSSSKNNIEGITDEIKTNVSYTEEMRVLTSNMIFSIKDMNNQSKKTNETIEDIYTTIKVLNNILEESKNTSGDLIEINNELMEIKSRFTF